MGLLERERELALVAGALEGARAGAGSVLLLSGEAGIGKTALVRAAAERAGPGVRVLRAACDPLTTPRALGPVLDLGTALGGAAARAAGDRDRDRLFDAVLTALRGPAPTLVVLEDLHWADDATADWLRFTARRAAALPVVLLATLREEAGAWAALGELAGAPSVRSVPLPALTLAAVVHLAGGDRRRAEAVYALAGGNPFLAGELLRAPDDALPRGVRDAVAARVRQLPPAARLAVEVASLVPGPVAPWLLTAAAGVGADAVDAAQAAAVLHRDGADLAFPHELVRLAVAADVPAARAAALHGRICDALEARYGERVDAVRLAHHAAAAGDGRRAARAAWRAGEAATAVCAHRDAVAHLSLALQHADELDAPERVRLLLAAGEPLLALGEAERLEAVLDDAVRRARPLAGTLLARALAAAGHAAWSSGRSEQGYRLTGQAVALVEDAPPSADAASVLADHAAQRMLARDLQAAVDVGDRALAVARAVGAEPVAAAALHAVGVARLLRDEDAGVAVLHEALDVARRCGASGTAVRVLMNLGSGAGEVRRYDAALPALLEAEASAERLEMVRAGEYARAWRGRVLVETGDWDAARACLTGDGWATASPVARMVASTALARLLVRTGALQAGAALLDEVADLAAASGDLQRTWPVAAARAELAVLSGRPGDVAPVVGPVLAQAREVGHAWAQGELTCWLWRAGEDVGPAGTGTPYDDAVAGRAQQAADRWESLGCPYEAAVDLADVPDLDTVRGAYMQLVALGALPAARQVRRRLLALGAHDVPPVPRQRGVDGALTARQREVLALLCEGASNAEVAARLVISLKTAEHHVSAVLQRLGARSRAEAVARALSERPLV